MALVFQNEHISLQDTSRTVTVPGDPVGKLMYYLDCICSAMELNDVEGLERLRDYGRYHLLMDSEKQALVQLCQALNPGVLNNKVIFHNDALCGDSPNKFYNLNFARQTLAVTDTVMVAGQSRVVNSIMTYKTSWLLDNYFGPMSQLQNPSLQSGKSKSKWKKYTWKCIKIGALILLIPVFIPLYCLYYCFCKTHKK